MPRLKLWPALWTLAAVPDGDPITTTAERGLRAALISRSAVLAARSQGGERPIERLLSVDQTCRVERRSLYAYLADVLTAKHAATLRYPRLIDRIALPPKEATMTSIQPQLWVENAREALAFYAAAFGATVLHLVGGGDDIVVQLGVGEAAFWVAPASSAMKRLSPRAIDGATSRMLLVVDDPDAVAAQAVRAGAKEASPVRGRIRLAARPDHRPVGHEWAIGKPLGPWPPT